MATRIAFYSPKGGSGKSTGISQVAGYLALRGESIIRSQYNLMEGIEDNKKYEEKNYGARVLIIDADPSFNATQSFYQTPGKPTIFYPHLMYWSKALGRSIGKDEILKTITPAYTDEAIKKGNPDVIKAKGNIFIAPSRKDVFDRKILELDREISADQDYDFYYRFFEPIFDEFDFILIDAPGQITGSSPYSALSLAQFVVTPSETDIYSSNALLETNLIINEVKEKVMKELYLLGFYYSRINPQRGLDRESKIFALEQPGYLKCAIKNVAVIPQLQGSKELVAFNKEAQRLLRDKDIYTGVLNDKDSFEMLTNEIIRRVLEKGKERRNIEKYSE